MRNKRGQIRKFSLCNFFPKNFRGQFFLIAAVVIIVVIVSIVTISNYTQKKDVVKLYDLGEELGIESQQVLDYGTYSELNETQMKTLMEKFIKNYVGYIGGGKNVYFIYGNKYEINVIGYQNLTEEDVCVKINPTWNEPGECIPIQTMEETQEFPASEGDIQKVAIIIGSTQYEFRLKHGENFYFIIWQEIGGEKHVVTSGE